MSQPHVFAVSSAATNLTPAEQRLHDLLEQYRAANSTDTELPQTATKQQAQFLEKYLDFQESLHELQQALIALKEQNAQQQPQAASDLSAIENYLHQLSQDFIATYKQAQTTQGVIV